MPKKRRPITARAAIVDGAIVWDNAAAVQAALVHCEGRYVVTIEPEHETRRDRQNKFYWKCVVGAIAEETEQDKDTIHAHLKQLFNSEVVQVTSPATGEVLEQRVAHSTASLSVTVFSEYVSQCILWAGEFLGLVIDEAERDPLKRKKET